ncbi:hypothetical protein, partial [Staphylococcus sp. 191]|uniref:hypothetical protein n=1 Tax=Staphylococcus sp. 191 TaxID=2070016 RepID=UPI001A9848EB
RRKNFTWRDDGTSKLSSGALGDLGVLNLCQESGNRKKRILPRFACSPSLECTFKNQKVHSKLGYFVAYFFSNSMGLI